MGGGRLAPGAVARHGRPLAVGWVKGRPARGGSAGGAGRPASASRAHGAGQVWSTLVSSGWVAYCCQLAYFLGGTLTGWALNWGQRRPGLPGASLFVARRRARQPGLRPQEHCPTCPAAASHAPGRFADAAGSIFHTPVLAPTGVGRCAAPPWVAPARAACHAERFRIEGSTASLPNSRPKARTGAERVCGADAESVDPARGRPEK